MRRSVSILTCLFLLAFAFGAVLPVRAQTSTALVLVLDMDGPITPAMHEYLTRGLKVAGQRGADLIVLRLNTPGGSITTMNEMVQAIRTSRIPVVVYIAPRGAMAASAGTMVTLAGHAAAMAPETIIGAASPISGEGQDLPETIYAKEVEGLKATVRTLAAHRGETAVALAEATIESARAVSAREALEAGLVDLIASDLDDLLVQLDGRTVETVDGQLTLQTAGARVETVPLSLIEQLLLMLTDPNIVFLLLSIGVQALFIELSSPGGWVAGFIGVACLTLAVYGLGILPVNWFGLIFLATAFVLFILDIKAPTHGALTAAGVASLIIGALVLFNSPGTPSFQRVSIPLVVGVSASVGLMMALVVGLGIRAQRSPARMGSESLPGKTGVARTAIKPAGQVQFGGELWSAELAPGARPIKKGEPVEVVAVEGLRLKVRAAGKGE